MKDNDTNRELILREIFNKETEEENKEGCQRQRDQIGLSLLQLKYLATFWAILKNITL